jgi:hypothetical protein
MNISVKIQSQSNTFSAKSSPCVVVVERDWEVKLFRFSGWKWRKLQICEFHRRSTGWVGKKLLYFLSLPTHFSTVH